MRKRKSRKSLDDILAQQFIYGDRLQELDQGLSPKPTSSKPPLEPKADVPLGATEETPNTQPLTDKFQTPPKEATIRFTVDLPASMHQRLSLLAARTGKRKAEIVRLLLDEVLKDVLQ
ncbi:MAG TPA: hypothetical protein V6D33_05860 [Cyanophyceae cyanobacterium]